MADSAAPAPPSPDDPRGAYLALVHRRRMYSGLALLIFAVLFVGGFMVADARNAGGF